MDMPQPTDEHRRLARLAGTWEGEETIHPSPFNPKGGTARGAMRARMDLGGFHLIMDVQQHRGGTVHFEGHGVFGWDPRGKCYTMHWFDSMGMEHGAPAIGTWEGDTLTLQHEMPHVMNSRYVYQVGDGRYRFQLQYSRDGKEWSTFLEGDYYRKAE